MFDVGQAAFVRSSMAALAIRTLPRPGVFFFNTFPICMLACAVMAGVLQVWAVVYAVPMVLASSTSSVLEMAGRQVAKCDQKSFGATSFGQKYVYMSPEELCLGDQL